MISRRVRENLDKCIRPFWGGLQDYEYGGYYGRVDFQLNVDMKAEKGVILNSRILWFFSNSYLLSPNEVDKKCADHAYEYMMKHCVDNEYGGVYWSTNYDGTVLDSTKHTYNQAFAIYALTSYYQAFGKIEALNTAIKLYELIEEKCTDKNGYLEAFDRSFEPVSNEKLSENGILADKTMNTLLHVFEAYTELYRASGDERVRSSMNWILDLFFTKVYNPELHRQDVFFDEKMNNLIDLQSYGHDIESAWLLTRGLEVLEDEELSKKFEPMILDLTESVYSRAFQNNSLVNECENGKVDTNRIWWVQAEAMVGFINGWQKTSNPKYYDAAEAIWEYVEKNFVDSRPGGEWFWNLDEQGKPIGQKDIVEPWKCPYHTGRMCMEIVRRLEYAS